MNIFSSPMNADRSGGEARSANAGYQVTQPEPEGTPLIRQYLQIALRWKWLIIGAVAACVVLGIIITLLMTPQFTATSTIEISREADQVTEFEGVERETSVSDQEFYQTQYGLLRARTLSERVAAELRLIDDPEFFEMFGGVREGEAFAMNGDRFGASGRRERQRIAGEILLANLSVEPTRLSRLVDINFTSPNAGFSARVANAWAENFIESNLERKVQSTSYGRDQLQAQLAEYKDRLDESQRQLVAYAASEEIINLPTGATNEAGTAQERSILADNLATLNEALAQATAERIAAESRSRQVGRSGASVEALTNPAINNLRQRRAERAAEYEQMMVQFEPGFPAARELASQIEALDASIAREESRVSGSLNTDYRAALQQEQALEQQVERLKSEFLDLRNRSIQYNIYQQEVDTNRALYDGLLQRFKEIGVAGGVGVNNIAIVDPADVPQIPSSPRTLLNLLISILAGLGIGSALAFAREQLDETIADPGELERRLGLPLLGSVPMIENETPQEALADRKSDLFDAYLAIQTNLAFTTEHGVPSSLAVTSTRPAEGKSTTALALATTLTRADRKVILVDGDMRSPSVHHYAGVTHDRGLSNYLSGEEDIETMIFPMKDLGFSAMTAGPIPPNAAELLTGTRFSTLIERLLETYDHVIFDAPPVMGLADAPLIASRVEGVVFTVESHGIRSGLVKTALKRLAVANARVFGGVLTKFEQNRAHYGYGYDYGYGYGREDKSASEA